MKNQIMIILIWLCNSYPKINAKLDNNNLLKTKFIYYIRTKGEMEIEVWQSFFTNINKV